VSKSFRVVVFCALAALGLRAAPAAEFAGWQGMRVVSQEGAPDRMFAADFSGDDRQELVVVNTRHSRLDLYRWQPPDERKAPYPADPERPNELPLAPDWSHTELPLEDLPADAAAADLDGDGRAELIVLTGPSLKLSVYHRTTGKWERKNQWDLPTASLVGRGPLLLVRAVGKRHEVLVSCDQGVLVVPLEASARAAWFRPRETSSRLDWRLIDVDGDGDDDLFEWIGKANQSVRWYENASGSLRAPQTLYNQSLQQVVALRDPDHAAEVLGLAPGQAGLVRRYRPSPGEDSRWGRRAALPLVSGVGAPWCGVHLGKHRALAAVDPADPRIRVYRLNDDEWGDEENYPTIGGIRALAAPASLPGSLLLWVKDAGDLFESRWENGRLSYPKTLPAAKDAVAERKILALETSGDAVWSVQRLGADVELTVWNAKQKTPERTRFVDVGAKTEKVLWLGGKRLLVQQAYAPGAKLVSWDAAKKTVIADSPHLAKVNFAEFGLYVDGDRRRVGRLVDGVLQWLDDDLQPIDQVMLADGAKLAGYTALADDEALGLEEGGKFLHVLKTDEAGVVRTTSDVKIYGATSLRNDPVLGLFLVEADHVLRLSSGRPWELELIDTIDGRIGRPSGVKEATIHRLAATDVDGDGRDEVVLCDDRRHQLTILRRQGRELESAASWQVFEDRKYPYGSESSEAPIAEPRTLLGFNADGDPHRDLALLSQDRLIIYLGRETKP
jgi:hypothetical protein